MLKEYFEMTEEERAQLDASQIAELDLLSDVEYDKDPDNDDDLDAGAIGYKESLQKHVFTERLQDTWCVYLLCIPIYDCVLRMCV